MAKGGEGLYGADMPPRPPINPDGWYHVGSRGCYGRTLFATVDQHEMFLTMYTRVARKYKIVTPSWALVDNHHHLVVQLTKGGLSEAMRELHGGYSRWLHEQYSQTGQGHLFRHAFFARELLTEAAVVVTCIYVDLNTTPTLGTRVPEAPGWCGYRATVGLDKPRGFHRPDALLELVAREPAVARQTYQELVHDSLAFRREILRQTLPLTSVVESRA
jgi:REP element-mobilizing transposase RayT